MVTRDRALAVAVAVAILGAACSYHDSFRDCTIACTADTGCPDGFACSTSEGLCRAAGETAKCASAVDAGVDVPNGTCFGSGAFTVCVTAPSPAPLTLPATIFTSTVGSNPVDPRCLDSTAWSWVGAGQPDACVMYASGVQAGATTRVFGARPLVVLATGSITIATNQLLDVASHHNASNSGPGAVNGTCAAFASAPQGNIHNGNGASGGGAGGSFAIGVGGNGGAGDLNQAGGAAAASAQIPSVLTAGCTGQTGPGGTGSPIIPSAPGGSGGGALYLASLTSITIAGRVNASGAGGGVGGGADYQTGGGGGGSGGMIVIAAPSVMATGTIIANGGGGASGGSYIVVPQLVQMAASPGADPDPMSPTTAAAGGAGTAAAGGSGFALGQPAKPGVTGDNTAGQGDAGGGGGGGGGGVIIAPAGALMMATVSPPPVVGS